MEAKKLQLILPKPVEIRPLVISMPQIMVMFPCNICGVSFSSQDFLLTHAKNHARAQITQDKPYSCTNSPESFKKMEATKSEAKIHSKPFSTKALEINQHLYTNKAKSVCLYVQRLLLLRFSSKPHDVIYFCDRLG